MMTEENKQEETKKKSTSEEKNENPFRTAAKMKKQTSQGRTGTEEKQAKVEETQQTEPAAETKEATPVVEAEPVVPAVKPGQEATADPQEDDSPRNAIVEAYAAKIKGQTVAQTARIQLVTTPQIKERLKELDANREIKSINHLINSLLKMYLGMEDD